METMTIQQLYDWAVAHKVQNFPLYQTEECYQCAVDPLYICIDEEEQKVIL